MSILQKEHQITATIAPDMAGINQEERLRHYLTERFGGALGEKKATKLLRYRDLLLERNKKVNLTSITNPQDFVLKHLLDSLALADGYEIEVATDLIDVGTGGGFPGVPLAVCFPEKKVTLLDAVAKRLDVVRELTEALSIENITVIHGRAEDLARQKAYRDHYDLCVSRAVAPLAVLVEYALPFVRPGGTLVAYKGPEAEEEAQRAERAILSLGGALAGVEVATIETADGTDLLAALKHTLIYIEKEEPTPAAYPRKAGTPSKRPL